MNIEEIIKSSKPLDLEPRTLIHITLVNNKIFEMYHTVLKPFEISVQQFNVLRILRGQKGEPANLSTINERMITKMSNTTRLVDKLIAKGYVHRCVCESNRRKVDIAITKMGLSALEKMDQVMTDVAKSLVGNLNKKELEQLNNLLDKF